MTTQTYDTDPKQKLYDTVKEKGLYTKSFDEFKAKYSTPEAIENLYNVVNKRELFTKSKDEFLGKYFAEPVKKKESGSSPLQSSGEDLKEATMSEIKAFVTGKPLSEIKANEYANTKPPAKITNAITQTKIQKPSDKSVKEEAENKITQIADEDLTDPIKGLNKLSQANPTNPKDILATEKAKEMLVGRMAQDGFDAKELLNRSFFGTAEDNNQTSGILREKAADYDKSVAPLRNIQVDDLTDATPEYLDNALTPQIKNAAIQYGAQKDPQFAKELQVMGLDLNDPDLFGKVGSFKSGQWMQRFLQDENVGTFLNKENPNLLPAIDRAYKQIRVDNQDYGINSVANEVSQAVQKSGFNNIDPVFNFYGDNHKAYADQVARDLYKDDPQSLAIWDKYIKDDQEKYMDAPSLMQGFAEGGEGVFKGIANTFTEPFRNASESTKRRWDKEALNVSADPQGIFKIIRETGRVGGLVAAISGTGNVLGAGGTGLYAQKIVPALSGGVLPFFGDSLEEGRAKYPDSPVKAGLSALVNTTMYAALSQQLFPAKSINQAIGKVSPDINNIVERLASGQISREAARQQANTAFKRALDFTLGATGKAGKITAELTAITQFNKGLDKIMMDEEEFKNYHPERDETDETITLFLSNIALGGFSKFGDMKKRNRVAEESYYELASNPKKYERMIDNLSVDKSFGTIQEFKENLKFISGIKTELDALRINPKDQKRFIFEALKEKSAKETSESASDSSVQQKNKDVIKQAKEVKEKILAGEDAETIITESQQKEIDKQKDTEVKIERLTIDNELDNKKYDKQREGLDGRNPEDKVKIEKIEEDRRRANEDFKIEMEKLSPTPKLPGIYGELYKSNPEAVLKDIAEQVQGVDSNGNPLEGGSRREDMIKQGFSEEIINEAVKKYPIKESSSTPMEATTEGAAENVVPSTLKDVNLSNPQKYTLNKANNDLPQAPEINKDIVDWEKSGIGGGDITAVKLLETRGENSEGVSVGTVRATNKDGVQETYEVFFKSPQQQTSPTNEQQTKPIEPVSETKETTTQVPDQTKTTITEPSEPNKAGEGAGGEPPIKPPKVTEGNAGDGMKDLDKLANNVPDSGKVAEYMSKETIEKYTGETPTNDQRRGVQELEIALNHGEKIIEKAQTVFGKDYVDKTLDYIENSTAPVSNKALMYVSLENALGREKLLAPERAADITKQQALVYEQSQKFARENSLALNYQKLRRIAKVGYDIEKITDSFFSPEELIAKENIKKAVEADADAINKEAEKQEVGGMTPEVEKLVQEGVEKEIAKIYEQLPKDKKTMADKAIAALEAVQKKLRGKTYDAGLGIPVAIVDAGITTVKLAIKAGVKVADAIELGINKIKEKWGKEWPKEDEFRKDLSEAFKNVKSATDFVKEALIEKGFSREITVKGEKKTILDWKKLAGKAGTVSKISENVAEVMKDKKMPASEVEAMKDALVKEYIDLRTSVIEKSQTELARRNKETVTPEQRSAARKLAELYTLGGFEGKEGEFDNAINKAFGAKVNEKDYSEAREIAKAMETIYTTTFKGAKLNDISGKAAIEKLEDRLRVLLFRGARQEGNTNLKIATMVRNYFELQQTLVLNNLKQAVENPLSGLQQNVISMIEGATSKEGQGTAAMADQRRKMMKTVYRDMVTKGGIGYGKTESTFVNRQHIDDFINKLSDNQLYHGIASIATGKTTLNAMDAMWKVGLTEKKFASNLIKVLTHETNKNKMSKDEAQKFVSEQLTGQTFKDAQKTATELIQKINKEAGKDLIPLHEQQVDRLANDIVKAALEMGGKITKEQIDAAFNAAYRSASLNLGHTANNFLSAMIHGQSAKIEGALNQAIKNKEWDRAAWLTYYSVFYRNILNPFVGGGTNWLVIKFEKTGLGLVTGLIYKKGTKTDLDLSTERGLKLMEDRLYNQSRIKDQYMRGLIGGITTWTAYAAFLGLAGTDDYRKWRANNPWAARYLDIVTPEPMLAHMAVENDSVKRYVAQSLNKNDAFDASGKLIKAADYFVKGKTNEGWGALGEMTGMKFNAPIPWRLVKDLQVLYQGITGQDPYHGNYKPSTGFFNGLLQGGVIEYLGFRPEGSGVTPKGSSPTKKQTKSNKKTEKKQSKSN